MLRAPPCPTCSPCRAGKRTARLEPGCWSAGAGWRPAPVQDRHRHQHRCAGGAVCVPRQRVRLGTVQDVHAHGGRRHRHQAVSHRRRQQRRADGQRAAGAHHRQVPGRPHLGPHRGGVRQGPAAADLHHQPRYRPAGDLEYRRHRRQWAPAQPRTRAQGHPRVGGDPRPVSAGDDRRTAQRGAASGDARRWRRCIPGVPLSGLPEARPDHRFARHHRAAGGLHHPQRPRVAAGREGRSERRWPSRAGRSRP